MERRVLGRTGLRVSVLGFGCGAVGGLMVRGTPAEQERAVARALDLGVNFLDTAPMYGNGRSERNVGRVLKRLRPDAIVATKVLLAGAERARIADAVAASLEASLRRLGRDSVDLLQLHNPMRSDPGGDALPVETVLEEVVPALDRLRRQGKVRFCGITAFGETPALQRAIDARAFGTAQVVYNLLNPSAGAALPPGFPAQDFGRLLERTRAAAVGVVAIRVLAGGALSGSETRHPLGLPAVEPMASGADYAEDVQRARRLDPLVREGHAGSLVEAALRFAIANDAVATALVGLSSLEQLELAASAAEKGPLPPAALDRVAALQRAFAGEARA